MSVNVEMAITNLARKTFLPLHMAVLRKLLILSIIDINQKRQFPTVLSLTELSSA